MQKYISKSRGSLHLKSNIYEVHSTYSQFLAWAAICERIYYESMTKKHSHRYHIIKRNIWQQAYLFNLRGYLNLKYVVLSLL